MLKYQASREELRKLQDSNVHVRLFDASALLRLITLLHMLHELGIIDCAELIFGQNISEFLRLQFTWKLFK